MQCTVHFIIISFNVDNVLQCVIYQLSFTVFMHARRISRYVTLYNILRLVLSTVFHNRGRSWNVLPVDTAAHLYLLS